jgi:aryl-alcohol dehydrogenase-like predicted oxidoreductase
MAKLMNRKDFIVRTASGIAGFRLFSRHTEKTISSEARFRQLGKTGIMVSPVCLGASRTNDESIIRYAVENGIKLIDTGRSYGNGNNERLVGRSISGKRKEVIIQTKIRLDGSELPSKGKGKKGATEIRNALSSSLEASLKALDTSYIDIVLYHDASDENLLFHSETMKYFDEMKKAGIIRAHGFSTHNDCMNLLTRNNIEGFYDVIMVPFNHKGAFTHSVTGSYSKWDQEKLISILTEASQKGKGIIAMKSCSGGPYAPSSGFAPNFQEAVKWVLQHKFISSASIAMVNFEQVNDHLPLLRVNL